MFNPNRETSDQGPFNSWDRQPFLTRVRNGSASLTPAYNEIHHNFMICNYGSNMCIDNDDGSSYYLNHHNFAVYGGHKSDFGGHNKYTYDSIDAYAQDYRQGRCGDFSQVLPGYVDGYYNNTCVQGTIAPYLFFGECDAKNLDKSTLPILGGNKVYNAKATIDVNCNGVIIDEKEWQAKGLDKNTKAFSLPSDEEIIEWGRKLLNV
eukprot:TRINITY_DN5293_c0_g1_i1.p1 TRINITY_DN5293_c0_g1~~TRINITY_DN5293_c0_g1_i1.p1  ORF type:complete len:206 (+),score=24.65 TRINITY_DN5293_c0_g1_i1:150-767(+)